MICGLIRHICQTLVALKNARLMTMREKIFPYTFKITWVAGKTYFIADALSRYPVFGPFEDNFNVDTAIKCLRSLSTEPESLKSIYAKQNEAYKSIMTELKRKSDFSKLAIDHLARAFKTFKTDSLSTETNTEMKLCSKTARK